MSFRKPKAERPATRLVVAIATGVRKDRRTGARVEFINGRTYDAHHPAVIAAPDAFVDANLPDEEVAAAREAYRRRRDLAMGGLGLPDPEPGHVVPRW